MADQKNKNVQSPGTKEDDLNNVDNGFFTDDDNRLQTKEEYEEDKSNHPGKNEKITPLEPDITTSTLGDKISIDFNNEDYAAYPGANGLPVVGQKYGNF